LLERRLAATHSRQRVSSEQERLFYSTHRRRSK
jgi:hypothetical protein